MHADQAMTAAAPPPRSRRTRRGWWFGGGVLLVAVAVVVTVVVVHASGSRVFTHYPADCALLAPATVDTYAPGDTCHTDHMDWGYRLTQQGGAWRPEDRTKATLALVIHLTLVRSDNDADSASAEFNQQVNQDINESTDIHVQHPVSGVGERAYFGYSINPEGVVAEMIVQIGNARIVAEYYGFSPNGAKPSFSAQRGELAVRAAVTDVIGELS